MGGTLCIIGYSSVICYPLSSALHSTPVFLLLALIVSPFIFGVSREPPRTAKSPSDIDLSFNRYHHLRCRILWIPTIVPHLPIIAPHRLTGLPRPIVSSHSRSLRLTHLPRACRPPVRSHRVRLPIQPPSDRMERPSTIHSSASFILLHVLRFGSHLMPTELSLQGNPIANQDVAIFAHLAILYTVTKLQTVL